MRDRVVIVTGAGSGIGAAVAERLAVRGAHAVFVGRRAERLEQTAERARALGAQTLAVPTDLASPDSPGAIVRRTLDRFGRVDAIVNNAANIVNEPFAEVRREDFDVTVAVNMRAAFFLIQEALPALREAPAPAVVNVSSAAAAMARDTQAVYGMTKAALEHLTRSLAMELAPHVRVNAVAPGPTETDMHTTYAADAGERKERLRAAVPTGRLGRPEEVAEWIVRLLEPEAAWVTGVTLHVDGGRVLGPPGVM